MAEFRLTERIARWGAGNADPGLPAAEMLVASILAHLQRILNTRQGSVPIDPGYGVPDFSNLATNYSSAMSVQMERDLERVIARYEPRLRKPKLSLVSDSKDALALRFELSGFVALPEGEVPVRLSTRVEPDGHIHIAR